ncbi:hypothetical protein [Dactylosporangium sp. CA-139066]|uniref:hypothetical protein n=1 Tax=Dactylosporangium sp. CA-139066 TaxID=3239930 RepID=UPI003D8FE9A4
MRTFAANARDAIAVAGRSSQEASHLLAVLGPVGIPANRIPHARRPLNGRRFNQWQHGVDAERAARRHCHKWSPSPSGHADRGAVQPPAA